MLALLFGAIGVLIFSGTRIDPGYLVAFHRQGWLWLYLTNVSCGLFNNIPQTPHFALVHFWTLALEEQFYLLWPLMIFLLRPRGIMRMCVACLIALSILRGALFHYGSADALFFLVRADGLFAGSMLACAVRVGWMPALHRRSAWVAFVLLAAMTPLFTGSRFLAPLVPRLEPAFALLAAYAPVHSVAAGTALMIATLGATAGGRLRGFMEWRTLRLFGELSYGLYVYHYFFEPMMVSVFLHHGIWLVTRSIAAVPIFVACAVATSLLIAWVSWHGFEKPILKLKRYFPYRRPTATNVATR